jgi:serine O-acetyltransferase
VTLEPIAWGETRRRMRADRARLAAVLEQWSGGPPAAIGLHPAHHCAVLYRLANHFARRGRRLTARFLWNLNFLLTGADISEYADLGEGLVILAPPGAVIAGKAGRNLTLMPCSGIGGEVGRFEDIGAGPGLAVLGDEVLIEPHAGVLGPFRIGDRVRIPAGVVITQDIPPDTVLDTPRVRFLRLKDTA